jgi:5-methyltetrahydropteroyltriglutamate--homocysteine methyltransferase
VAAAREPRTLDRTGHENLVPRVVGEIRRTRLVEVRDVEFASSITDCRIKITFPGPSRFALPVSA